MLPSFDECYRAVRSRDPRFDGWIYVAVTTTGIYCRPSCPAMTPKQANVRFFPTAAAAQDVGFRACRRCRPDAVPGSPEWDIRADVAARAMRLIDDGVVERDGVHGLAARLGYSARHLGRVLSDELGAGPLALARARRAHAARLLLETTALPVADIAFAAGFGSVRQFNDTVRAVFASTPLEVRKASRESPMGRTNGVVSLRLPYRPPYDSAAVWAYLSARAVPGLEEVSGNVYRRSLRLHYGVGILELEPADSTAKGDQRNFVRARLSLQDLRDLGQAVSRARRLLHADADPAGVVDVLGSDSLLGTLVRARPGLRVPGSVDAFETAVRTVIGQQISISGARTVTSRLVASYGTELPVANGSLTHTFPSPSALADLVAEELSMPRSRAGAIAELARAVSLDKVPLDRGAHRSEVVTALLALPGIGPWTAEYVSLRGLGDPDAFPGTDLGIRQAMVELGVPDQPAAIRDVAERWRPLRSYAAQYLWTSLG